MRWFKGDLRKNDLVIISVVFFMALLFVVSALLGWWHQTVPSGQTTGTGTVQGTSAVDATAVAGDILKQQDEKLQRENSGLWPYWLTISGSIGGIGAILAAVAAFIAASRGFKQWLGNRQDEQVKRVEERFQKVVEGLGSERVEAKVGAAIVLRTFLQKEPGYEQFYIQTFDLAVAHLRLRGTNIAIPKQPSSPSPSPIIVPSKPLAQGEQDDPNILFPLDSLSQALITVFKESFPLACEWIKKQALQGSSFDPATLDATDVRLDHAYLVDANLAEAWLVQASLRKANLSRAHLEGANLRKAHLEEADLNDAHLDGAQLLWAHLEKADLNDAHLEKANLYEAQLKGAQLTTAQLKGADLYQAHLDGVDLILAQLDEADLMGAHLEGANLSKAQLKGANLRRAHLDGALLFRAHLEGANLSRAQLKGADLTGADLTGANPGDAASLEDTKMNGVIGLKPEQREACIKKGAIFDDVQQSPASDTRSSSSLSPAQSNDTQALSAPSAQVNTPTPGTDGSSASPSSQTGS